MKPGEHFVKSFLTQALTNSFHTISRSLNCLFSQHFKVPFPFPFFARRVCNVPLYTLTPDKAITRWNRRCCIAKSSTWIYMPGYLSPCKHQWQQDKEQQGGPRRHIVSWLRSVASSFPEVKSMATFTQQHQTGKHIQSQPRKALRWAWSFPTTVQPAPEIWS